MIKNEKYIYIPKFLLALSALAEKPLSTSDLSFYMHSAYSYTYKVKNGLVNLGLIEESKKDGRTILLKLTKDGQKVATFYNIIVPYLKGTTCLRQNGREE